MRRLLPLALACTFAAGCSATGGPPPSLAPRAAEAIDPRVPVVYAAGPERPVSASVAERLAGLVAQALNGDAAFDAAASEAEARVASAGAPQSESWIVAQQALTHAVAARGPTSRALGDVDAMAAEVVATKGDVAPADFEAIRSTASKIAEIDQRQAARVDAMQRRLGS